MKALLLKNLASSAAIVISAVTMAGCAGYYGGGGVVIAAPGPVQFYYDSNMEAYYCYRPGYGWAYYPGVPGPNVVFWSGAPPVYLPPPPVGFRVYPPPVSFQFYFDPVHHVYYYHDPHAGWRYYHGPPPRHAHIWHGAAPRFLPRAPAGAPHRPPPGKWGHWDHH